MADTNSGAGSKMGLAPPVIAIPACKPGIGDVILSPESPRVIAGLQVMPYPLWPDDRGFFLEILRVGKGLGAQFDPASTQVSAALTYPHAIKAFHYHLHQTDLWAAAQGMLQVALVDLRSGSSTFGVRNTLYIGTLRPWQILIPPGVGHGYKVIGNDPAMLIYVTDRFYNPEDEGRIPYNHPDIAYDWELQHK
ncbi:MAG TPA: dTDP-4-dehydrorhamnose 3,5-epimerase family protein [Bryobacteraceae bacterium]|nr:dTDP-4-dehydrorhamnose 3,5-epimerase family protein [Bryobacteraceae bacterium]